jgi:hypothetical protein
MVVLLRLIPLRWRRGDAEGVDGAVALNFLAVTHRRKGNSFIPLRWPKGWGFRWVASHRNHRGIGGAGVDGTAAPQRFLHYTGVTLESPLPQVEDLGEGAGGGGSGPLGRRMK